MSIRDFTPLPDGPHANAGMDDVPVGLDCGRCGKAITVSYMAHGKSATDLVSDPMLDLVKAAGRAMAPDGLCSTCAPPQLNRIRRVDANYRPGGFVN